MPVYFIGNGNGQVKIGYSKEPFKRLASLQTASPYRLELLAIVPGTEETEDQLHRKFASYRLAGEWFTLSDSIRYEIDASDRSLVEISEMNCLPGSTMVKRRDSPGRPPREQPAQVIRLVLSLDPDQHSDLIAKLTSAPQRGLAAMVTDMMTHGLQIAK